MALHPGTASLNELEALIRVTPGLAFAARARALQEISARPLLWSESLGSFKTYLNARWKELGFVCARMAQRYAAAALVMSQVGGEAERARPVKSYPRDRRVRCSNHPSLSPQPQPPHLVLPLLSSKR
jgi:hypothetical protein